MPIQQSTERGASTDAPPFWVMGLCAQWCGVCREFEPVFGELAQRFPQVRFAWLDVEDERIAAALGELDVETFPFVIAGNLRQVVFEGPVLPQGMVLERLIAGWTASVQPETLETAPLTPKEQPQNVLVCLLAAIGEMPNRGP